MILSIVKPNGRDLAWGKLILLPAIISFSLLVLPQAGFIWMSFREDLGYGLVSETATLNNYITIFTDSFYLQTIWLTLYLSAAATITALLLAFPTAYALARIGGWTARIVLTLILTTSLITIVIKLLGLNILLGSSGLVNQLLLGLAIISEPLVLTNNEIGVYIGLVQYTLPILILLLFSVVQTIPQSTEEAAEIHGASRFYLWTRILLPLAKPGILAGGLIAFNMSMGAFTSAVLLGGGRVITMPVLIQQKMIQSTEYGMAAALSTVLLLFVFVLNVLLAKLALPKKGANHG
jgi:putative spermidine/putrescine transport system permease protein